VPSSGPQSPHTTLLSNQYYLHWLKIKQRIDYKILSLTYKVLTTTQPSYLYNLISVQPHRSTYSFYRCRPPSSSYLKVNNRSFHYASPCLWNQLPKELHLPADHDDLSLLSDLTHVSSSFPSPSLSPSITQVLSSTPGSNSSFPRILSSIVLYLSDW